MPASRALSLSLVRPVMLNLFQHPRLRPHARAIERWTLNQVQGDGGGGRHCRLNARRAAPEPFALSLSKGTSFVSDGDKEGVGFDKLSPNGVGWVCVCQIRRTLL
jgi:hypothetical protein